MDYHPAATLFPLMTDEEFAALKEDIEINGLREPLWIYEDKLIDGRNRYRACMELGIKPEFREWDGKGSLVAFVVSLNLKRRHLSSGQKAVIALEVERQLAVEAKERQRGGQGGVLLSQRIEQATEGKATQQAAALTGTNRQYVSDAKRIERDAPEVLERVRNGSLTIPEAKRLSRLTEPQREDALSMIDAGDSRNVKDAIRKTRLAGQVSAIENTTLPRGKFHVISADPPWAYTKRAEDTTHRGACPYPTMDAAAICAMPVGELAHDDCILWLWTTNAFMKDAYQVAEAWGFEVKTILTWAKDRMGLGDWLRGQTEHCLMAVRGRPVVVLTNQTTLLHGPLREHSRKPDEFYTLVERLCPGSKCELFSRETRPGWESFGAEVEMFDEQQ